MQRRSENRFWEREEPEMFEKHGLQWKLYRLGGKLQIKRFNRFGKFQGITIDRRAVSQEVVDLLKRFIDLNQTNKGE